MRYDNGTNSYGCVYLAHIALTQVVGRSKCHPLRGVIAYKFGIISMQPKYISTGTSQFPSGHATGNANSYLRRSRGWLSQGENADDE